MLRRCCYHQRHVGTPQVLQHPRVQSWHSIRRRRHLLRLHRNGLRGPHRGEQRHAAAGRLHKVTLLNVLISPKFPFHIVSEIVLFEKKCKASESDGSWTFFRPSNGFLMHASQRLLKKSQGRVNEKLYFIDEAPSSGAASEARVVVTRATNSRGVLIATLSVLHYR